MRQFQIPEEDLRTVVKEGLNLGADYVDIYFEHSCTTMVSLLSGGENRASQNIDYGAGVRVVTGERTGYAYTEDVTPQSLLSAVRQAARICNSTHTAASVPPVETHHYSPDFYVNEGLTFQPTGDDIHNLVDYLNQLRDAVMQAESRVVSLNANIAHRTKRFAVFNSFGHLAEEERPVTSLSVSAVIRHEGRTERANESRSYLCPLTMLTPQLLDDVVSGLVHKLHFALTAVQARGGEMPVVMSSGSSGVLLHEAVGHAFEADFIRRGESIFTDSLGRQICDPSINIVDDGTLPQMRGSIHFDDEGVPSQCTHIVTDGRLTSFLHDRISARHFGIEPTGNGRRNSFRHIPIPRMRNTYMLSGPCREQDLIADVKQGIYVCDLSNGQVQIGAGDYSFFVSSGYLIENGRLTQPIKDVNIIGNGPQTLADIRGVANNLYIPPFTWQCGKEGQTCPVSCGMPSVLVNKLTVG
ncbi:MAG: TldD/PmbA family protein [Bacteroidales bacterium]|nr:TldD/PmbA family protein [Candidatus Liminaster caballi]